MKIWCLLLNGQGLRSEAATNFVLSAVDGATVWERCAGGTFFTICRSATFNRHPEP